MQRAGYSCDGPEDVGEEAAQPQRLLHAVHCCDIFTFSCGKKDDFLLLGEPGDSVVIDKEGVALKGSLGFSIQELEVAHACQIVEDSLNYFPMSWFRV